LWSFIKPYRNYLKNKTKWNIYEKITILNNKINKNNFKLNGDLKLDFMQSINSYLWLIKWSNSYKLRKKILFNNISPYFWNYFYISNWYEKVVSKRERL
jgi:hypothetical protein